LRGLISGDCREGSTIKPKAFEEYKKTAETRQRDGRQPHGTEVSINWEEDTGALTQLRGNEPASRHGIARLPLQALEAVCRCPGLEDCLHWEYHRIPNNDYHGNIVYLDGVPKPRKLAIQHVLAQAAHYVDDD
jgi:hypothetical protein